MEIYTILFWMILGILAIHTRDKNVKTRGLNDKIKIVLIIVLFYYIIYFLSGLIFDYKNSPYSLKIYEITKNILYIVLVRIMIECVRTNILLRKKSIYIYGFVTIIFAIIQLSFNVKIQDLIDVNELLKYILSEAMPALAESALLTYLSLKGSYSLNLSYTLPTVLILIIAPIFPDIDWFAATVLKYVELFLIFLFINYEDDIRTYKTSRRKAKKQTPIKNIPIILLLIIIVCFSTGVFKYKPVAIVSNSMQPIFSRGDICIIKTMDKDNMEKIKAEDIIEYRANNISIIHRIVRIQKQHGNIQYITKGDNNNTEDLWPVEEEQIEGLFVLKIPYIGYPSVWFSELFLKK